MPTYSNFQINGASGETFSLIIFFFFYRLTIQNARDVLLSDKLPENLVNEPEADGSIKEAILKDLESEINFYDTSSSSSNEEEQETKNNSLKNSIKNRDGLSLSYISETSQKFHNLFSQIE